MIAPGALVLLTPLVVGILFGTRTLAGVLAGALVSGVQMAVSMSNTGGAWDNAKKYVEVCLRALAARLTCCMHSQSRSVISEYQLLKQQSVVVRLCNRILCCGEAILFCQLVVCSPVMFHCYPSHGQCWTTCLMWMRQSQLQRYC